MHHLSLMLTSLVLIAPPEGAQDDASSRARAVLNRVIEMDRTEQLAWLRKLEARLNHACEITLSPALAAQMKARYEAALRQKTIPTQTLLQLIREADGRENLAIGQLTPQYRVRV
ncbi:unnamed protein product, partial [marine sediment metagenome]